jgi:hypothetical protein
MVAKSWISPGILLIRALPPLEMPKNGIFSNFLFALPCPCLPKGSNSPGHLNKLPTASCHVLFTERVSTSPRQRPPSQSPPGSTIRGAYAAQPKEQAHIRKGSGYWQVAVR